MGLFSRIGAGVGAVCAITAGFSMLPASASLTGTTSTVSGPIAGSASWAPPALTSPVTIQLGDRSTALTLSTTQDYLLKLPTDRAAVMPEGLQIFGGHNVVLIGGAVDVAGGYVSTLGQTRRGMYLKGQTGTAFVEGVSFGSSTVGTLTEGIDLDQRYGAVVVLQHIHEARLTGSYTTNHADGLQTWAGPRKLLIDGLSIDTGYQGMFLLPNQHFTGPMPELWDFRNISIKGEASSAYMMWKDNQNFPFHLSNVYVSPGTHALTDRSKFLWDPTNTFTSVVAQTTVPAVATTAGIGYVSAGYGNTTTSTTLSSPTPVATSSPTPVASSTSTTGVLYRVNAGGSALSATPGWTADTATSPSTWGNSATAYSTTSSTTSTVSLANSSVPAGTPMSLFQSLRYDTIKGSPMQWAFPVPASGTYVVRLYFAETYSGCWSVGCRVFDVYANGSRMLYHQDTFAEVGKNAALVKTFSVPVTAGVLNLQFLPIVQNPEVQGIEILRAG